MMDLVDLEKKITKKTKAILAVHLFGQTLPINRIEEIVRKNNLILIEDAAQSLGATYKNRPAGSMGLASCFSFDPTKIIGAFGNGGVILTDDEILYERAKKLNYHGKNLKNGEFESLGFNSRLATSQAALLNLQFEWLDGWIVRRNEIANLYKQKLKKIREIEVPNIREGCNHIFHKYVIKTKERDKLNKFLSEKGINTKIHYNKAIYEYEVFKNKKFISNNLPIVNQVKQKVLSLPIYPELTKKEVLYVCEKIKNFYK
jgi:dTDP-4-amino-4,6-dideoxygalactose transaminase